MLLRLRTDEQLVALFRQGNEDAFRVIHDRYRQRLSAYARQMLGGSPADADDAMQDVFLRAYGALRADDRPITLRAWLYRVAHNRCIDHLRRPASQPTLELCEKLRPLAATTGDPIVAAEQREDLRRLVTDLRALPEQQRSALLMREMEGLSYVELSGALSVTLPAVKSLLVRARMGLVESQQARDTPCLQIREQITDAHDRGVRASGQVRRHARECPGCAGYRTTLKAISTSFGALNPVAGPWGVLAKLLGLGAGGSGAAGGAAAAGGGAVAAGGGAAGVTAVGATGTVAAGAATKLAAVVCCAAVFGGGVEVVRESATGSDAGEAVSRPAAQAAAPASAARAAPSSVVVTLPRLSVKPSEPPARPNSDALAKPAATPAVTVLDPSTSSALPGALAGSDDGGAEAPPEEPAVADGTLPLLDAGAMTAPADDSTGTGTHGAGPNDGSMGTAAGSSTTAGTTPGTGSGTASTASVTGSGSSGSSTPTATPPSAGSVAPR